MAIGNIYFIAAIAIIGGGLFGFDISSMSAIIPGQPYLCYFNQGEIDDQGRCPGPNSDVQGGITAAMPGGSWLGALVSGVLTDWLGRKKAIMIGAVIWCIGSAIMAASQNIGMLVAGRIINGFCVGICSAQIPVYISELAPPNLRGRLVGAQQWAITWGIMIMFYVSYGCSFLKGTNAFRVPWGLQAIPGALLFVGMMFLPESPRWLARKDRWEECKSVLVLVLGKGDPNSEAVAREYSEIQAYCEFERQNADVTYLELLKPRMINRTHIGVFTQIWSQLTGMNVMMYYITYVFTMAGETGNQLLVSSSIQYVINVVMTIPALLFVDKWGRRPTLLVGVAFMATWLFANAGIMATYGRPAPPGGVNGIKEASWQVEGAAAKAVIACSYLFVASFAPTVGPVSWIYPPELFPLRVRGKAVALATSANWAFNFALSYFVPPAFVNIQWRTYIIFGVFCITMFIHIFFLFPETARKPLEEIEEIFEDESGIKYIGTPAWKTRVGSQGIRRRQALEDKFRTSHDTHDTHAPHAHSPDRLVHDNEKASV
jgi:sugar porter (SP) family MFS transporter